MSAGNPEAHKTSKISIALSEESSRPNQGTMANSDFWRDLADQFLALQDTRLRGVSVGNNFVYNRLDALIERGASKIAGADAPNLLGIWLEALRKEGLDFHFSSESNKALSEGEHWQSTSRAGIDSVCQTSATLCRILEARARHADRPTQKGHANPRTRKRSNQEAIRDAFMFLAIKQGLNGMSYCRFLHENKIGTPHKWVSDGCPKSYLEAYNTDKAKPWRQRIQDEKYRAGRKLRYMEDNEPDKLKKLLGIASRATR
jgi:hypothetical protein